MNNLSIWDEAAYFALPIETPITLATTPLTVANGDPMRRFLVFNVNPGTGAVTHQLIAILSTRSSVNTTEGLIGLTVQNPWVILSWDTIGPLVQQTWYGVLAAGITAGPVLTVTTTAYNQWPGDSRRLSLLEQIDRHAAEKNNIRRQNRYRRDNRSSFGRFQQSPRAADNQPTFDESGQLRSINNGNGDKWLAPDCWWVPGCVR